MKTKTVMSIFDRGNILCFNFSFSDLFWSKVVSTCWLFLPQYISLPGRFVSLAVKHNGDSYAGETEVYAISVDDIHKEGKHRFEQVERAVPT